MSGTRVNQLAENSLGEDLDTIERTLRELKTGVQYLSGSSIVYFTTSLPGTYDFQGQIPDPGGIGYGGKLFLVETVATTMDFLWANLRIDLYKGIPPVIYRGDSVMADKIAGLNAFIPNVYDVPNSTSDPRYKSFYVSVTGPAGVSAPQLSVKMFVEALDEVAITITELN